MHPWCGRETLCLWWGSVLTYFLKLVPWVHIKAKQTEVIGCTCGTAVALLLHRSLDVLTERMKRLGQGHWEWYVLAKVFWLGARAGQPAFVFQHERHGVLSCFFLSFFILCSRSSPGLPYSSTYSSTKPPHSQPSFSHSFPANYNFPFPIVSKISLSHRFLCLSSFFSHVREAF